jgi:hypothetical protein
MLSGHYGVRVDVAGFDLGTGMPTPVDYRDVPYVWQPGFFSMDEDQLRARLKSAQLHIGDMTQTGHDISHQSSANRLHIFDMDY